MSDGYNTDGELLLMYAKALGVSIEDAKLLTEVLASCIKETVICNGSVNIKGLGLLLIQSKKNVRISDIKGNEIKVPLRYRVLFKPSASFVGLANTKIKKNFKVAFNHAEGIPNDV